MLLRALGLPSSAATLLALCGCAAAPRARHSGAPAAGRVGAGAVVQRVEELPATAATHLCARRVRVPDGREYVLAGFSVERTETTALDGGGTASQEGAAVGTYAPVVSALGDGSTRLRVDCRASRVLGTTAAGA